MNDISDLIDQIAVETTPRGRQLLAKLIDEIIAGFDEVKVALIDENNNK